VAALSLWSTHTAQESAQQAALKQQRLNFAQERAIADRGELRQRLDESAGALDNLLTDSDRLYHAWHTRGHHIKYPSASPKLVNDLYRCTKLKVRLGLRLPHESRVVLTYENALLATHIAAVAMSRFDPRQRKARVGGLSIQQWRREAAKYEARFLDFARRMLSSSSVRG
jgi:hypothetical protein